METRVALLSIIVSDGTSILRMNEILHDYAPYVIGRMGIPYRARNVNIISVAVDAPQEIISAISGKIGRLEGVSSRVTYANVFSGESKD